MARAKILNIKNEKTGKMDSWVVENNKPTLNLNPLDWFDAKRCLTIALILAPVAYVAYRLFLNVSILG